MEADGRQERLLRAGYNFAQHLFQEENVSAVYVIGSLINDKNVHQNSDLDLVVKGLEPERFFKVYTRGARKFPGDLDDLDLIPYENADSFVKKQLSQNSIQIKKEHSLNEFLTRARRVPEKTG